MTLKESFPQVAAPPESEVLTVLREARARIEQGWTKRYLKRSRPKRGGFNYCMVGAVVEDAAGWVYAKGSPDGPTWKALRLVVAHIPNFCTDDPGCIAQWNDAPDRKKEEVLAVYDAAIKAAGG